MLELIRVYDHKKAWAQDGTAGMEGWLVFQLGIPHRVAADWVSVANALDSLPLLSAAYSEGRLCFIIGPREGQPIETIWFRHVDFIMDWYIKGAGASGENSTKP